MQFELPIRPAGKQVDFWRLLQSARFFLGIVGRQFGKTELGVMHHVLQAVKRVGTYGWIGPNAGDNREAFEDRFLAKYHPLISRVNKTHMEIEWLNGSLTRMYSGERGTKLKGKTLHGLTMDEAALIDPSLWYESAQPFLAVNQGWACMLTTPKGKNWIYELANGTDFETFHATSLDAPYFPDSEFYRIKENTPERTFRQEYLAEFLEHGGEVFRNIKDCIQGIFEPPANGSYVMGVDLAKLQDWTVLTVMDADRKHVVAIDRFNQISYPLQKERIASLAQQYNARVLIDSTGVGEPVFDDLQREGLYIEPFQFTRPNKLRLIDNLALNIEQRLITFPQFEPLINELNLYQVEATKTGHTYNAPAGYHDDCVISLALACYALQRGQYSVENRSSLWK